MSKRTKSKPKAKRIRLNMRVPSELLLWAKVFAADKHTSVTQLFINHLTELKEKNDDQTSLSR